MSARAKTVYRCTECGAEHPKWAGRCDACGEWNTLAEEVAAPRAVNGGAARRKAGVTALGTGGRIAATPPLREIAGAEDHRLRTGLDEFDFVLGGGIVPGSMILIGGEPGIGKSTILLQVAARLEGAGIHTLYVSGEESPLQVKLRADRLGGHSGDVPLLGETLLETILATGAERAPAVMIVDSIQTVFTGDLEGAPGNVGQVRECAARLMRFAKESGTAVFVVGHVTKGGGIAGPKTLEHIVDTVLYFEGEGTLDHRLVRATKNRFGSVDEIGVFRMTEQGLIPVDNPSALFLGDREVTTPRRSECHAQRCSRGHGRCCSKCRRWRPRPASVRRNASRADTMAAVSRCCSPCSTSARVSRSRNSMFFSTSSAACAYRSRPVTSRSPRRSRRACTTRRFPRTRCSSARWDSAAKSARCRRWSAGSPRPTRWECGLRTSASAASRGVRRGQSA